MPQKIIFLLIVLISVSMNFANSQSGADSLRGIVYNAQNGEPLAGASVFIEELETGTSTGKNGQFQFNNLTPGTYSLEIRFIGFKMQNVTVAIPYEEETLTLYLKPDLIESDDIIVTSSPAGRNVQYQPAQAFTREDLQRRAAPSIGEMLDGSPGVSMRSSGSAPSRPVIRGMDGDRVLILQNGERMGDLSETAADHAISMEPLMAERIEVVRGPASLLYGSSAIGGVINIFSHDLPRNWDPGISGNVSTQGATVNKLGAGLFQLQQGTENWAFTGRGSFREAGNVRTPDGTLPESFISSHDFAAGAGYRKERFKTGAAFSFMNLDYGLPEGIDDPDDRIELQSKRFQFQSISSLDLEGPVKNAEFRVQLNRYEHDELEFDGIQSGNIEKDLELKFEQLSVSTSVTFTHDQMGFLESGAFGVNGFWRELNVSGAEALTPDAENFFIAGFLFEEIGLSEAVSLQTGTRLEFRRMVPLKNQQFTDLSEFEKRNDLIFSGSVGLNVRPVQNVEIGAQIARAFRTPTVEELFSNSPHPGNGTFDIGNPTLANETSLGTDLFVRYNSRKLSLELAGFANRIDNFVKFTPTGNVDQASNLPIFEYNSADALLIGFEFSSAIRLASRWTTNIVVDFVKGSERNSENTPLPFMPPLRSSFELKYDQSDWWTSTKVRLSNSQNRLAPEEERTAGYALVGIQAGYRFQTAGNHSFVLRLDNLLNSSYRDHLSRVENRNNPMPGRNANISWRWAF